MTTKTRRKARPKAQPYASTYTRIHELLASSTQPLDEAKQWYQIERMRFALRNIETAPNSTVTDWRMCSDAVNLMETLLTESDVLTHGHALPGWWMGCDGEPVQVIDTDNMLLDAVTAMATAGKRKFTHGVIRLDGRGLVAVRGLLDDYASLLAALPARTIIRAHRLTERRVQDILHGKNRPHDVEIIDL
jgi:hypothetical protein